MTSFIKRNRTVIISVALALFSIHLALTDTRVGERGFIAKRLISITVTPVQNAMLAVYRKASYAVNGYILVVSAKKESEQYRTALMKANEENRRLREEIKLSGRLKGLLGYKETAPFETTSAAILAYNTIKWTRTSVINKGGADGIKKDMAVITPDGVVGRIINVTPASSTVLLNTDLRSNIEAIIGRTRVRGIVEGNGSDGLLLKYVRELDDVKVGDLVITSGFSGLFPKGLVIGEITGIRKGRDNFFKHIEITPKVDFGRLEDVLVVTKAAPLEK